jgi:hypothetical protein
MKITVDFIMPSNAFIPIACAQPLTHNGCPFPPEAIVQYYNVLGNANFLGRHDYIKHKAFQICDTD